MLTFSHSGKIGDILYSLHYVYESTKHQNPYGLCNFNINTGKAPAHFTAGSHNYEPMMTMKDALFVAPLLEALPFINKVTIDDEPDDVVPLDAFRAMTQLNQSGGDIRDWYYQLDNEYLPRNFVEKLIDVKPDPSTFSYRDHVLVCITERYKNPFVNFSVLQPYSDNITFIGTRKEFDVFNKEAFAANGIIPDPQDSLLTVAKLMARAKGFIGNQSGFYALAEMMKIPRILIPADWVLVEGADDGKLHAEYGGKTTLPIGGWCCTAGSTERMICMARALLELR